MSEADEGPIFEVKVGGDEPLSILDAARAVAKARDEADKPAEPPKEAEPPVEQSAAPEVPTDDAPVEAPVEQTQEQPEAELPPIEPPRSWTKAEKERFATFPRETQEYLRDREQARDRAINQSLQEAAEQRKTFEAERQKAEQVRAQYEAALPQMAEAMRAQFMGEFADIKTWQDVEALAQSDYARYQRFQISQQKLKAANDQLVAVQHRQAQEADAKWKEIVAREDKAFVDAVPEMADPAKARALQDRASKLLRDFGFSDNEVTESWNGRYGIPLRDHRVQLLIRDATLWREAQAKAQQVQKAPLPPVQRPGTARSKGDANMAEITQLREQLPTLGSGPAAMRAAARLAALQRSAR